MRHPCQERPALLDTTSEPVLVRISQGSEQRWIWPVHLPGWLALGWQLVQPGHGPMPAELELVSGEKLEPDPAPTGATPAAPPSTGTAEPPAALPPPPEQAVTEEGKPRRGRKAKAPEPALQDSSSTEGEAPVMTAEASAEVPAAEVSVLPDDLLGDPF